jgi:predicted RND superfamily exporter protein
VTVPPQTGNNHGAGAADPSATGIARAVGWLCSKAIRYPIRVVTVLVLITAAALATLPTLKLQGGIYELFPHQPGPIAELASYGQTFGGRHELVVLVTGKDVAAVTRATRLMAIELGRSPHIREVSAGVVGGELAGALGPGLLLLAGDMTWPSVKKRLTRDLDAQVARLRRLLLSPLPTNREALTRDPLGLAELVLGGLESNVDHQTGLYVNGDGTAALIFARPRGSAADGEFRDRLQQELMQIRQRVVAAAGAPQVDIDFTGSYSYAFHFAQTLKRDLTLSGLVALAGVMVVLLLFFRSIRLVPLAGVIGSLAVCWTLALAALTVGGLNALSLAFAALCIGMGMDALIHITARTREFSGESPTQQIQAAIQALAPAMLAASLTTVAAFLCFSRSSFAGLSQTGLLAASGLAITLLLTLVLVPAFSALVPGKRAAPRLLGLDRALGRLAHLIRRWRWAVLLLSLVGGAAAVDAATQLRFSGDISKLASPDFPPVRVDRSIAQHFERSRHRWIVLARGDDQQTVLQVNDGLAGLMGRMRAEGRISGYRSLSALLPSLETQRARRRRVEALGPGRVASALRGSLERAGLRADAFQPFFTALAQPREVAPARLPASLQPLVRRQLARQGRQWVAATLLYPRPEAEQQLLRRSLEAMGTTAVQVRVTGAAMAGDQMAWLLRKDLLLICLLSVMVVLVTLGLLLRRSWAVVATLISLLVAGAGYAGVLSLMEMEIDLYNLMVLPVLIGYGVDDHVYIVRRAMSDGIEKAGVESGRAVLATTLTSMVAFGALALCGLPGLRTLGLCAVIGLGMGLVGALVVLPALLALGPRTGGSAGAADRAGAVEV